MTRVILDQDVQAKLQHCQSQLELCDEAGRTLGFFLSVADYHHLIQEWARAKYPEAILEQRAQEPGERTTAEVLERLRAS